MIYQTKGIEYAKNLTELNLSKNNIKDTSYLEILSILSKLDLSNNKIEDLAFLSELKSITSINLSNNNISYVPDFSNFEKLEYVDLSSNQIKDLSNLENHTLNKMKILMKDQIVLLDNSIAKYKEPYILSSDNIFASKVDVYLDNIQVSGDCKVIEKNKKPYMSYSVSDVILKDIHSSCTIRANFYYENKDKSIIYSGVLLKSLLFKNVSYTCEEDDFSIIYGNIDIKSDKKNFVYSDFILENRVITIIDSLGNKFYTKTNEYGEYDFQNIKSGKYIILYPYIYGYEYLTPSIHFIDVECDECLEINSVIYLSK